MGSNEVRRDGSRRYGSGRVEIRMGEMDKGECRQ